MHKLRNFLLLHMHFLFPQVPLPTIGVACWRIMATKLSLGIAAVAGVPFVYRESQDQRAVNSADQVSKTKPACSYNGLLKKVSFTTFTIFIHLFTMCSTPLLLITLTGGRSFKTTGSLRIGTYES